MADEFVTIAGQKMDIPGAVAAVDLTPLVLQRGGVRGRDLTVEQSAGDLPKGRVRAAWRFQLAFNISGSNTLAGVSHGTSLRTGAMKNVAALRDLMLAPYTSSNTVQLVHTWDDGSEWEAPVIVSDMPASALDAPQLGRVIRLVLDVKVPSGQLVEVAAT